MLCCREDLRKIINTCKIYGKEFNWNALNGVAYFDNELKKEISKEHSIYEIETQAVMKCDSCDDVLFALNSSNKYAIAHLTYNAKNSSKYTNIKYFENVDMALEYIVEQYKLEYL